MAEPTPIDWRKMEHDVVERIRALAAIDQKEGELFEAIRRDLILPNVNLLAAFCMAVEITDG